MMIEYIYKKGDCLCKIANKFNVTVQEIADLNGITNVDIIKVGDILYIGEQANECNDNK